MDISIVCLIALALLLLVYLIGRRHVSAVAPEGPSCGTCDGSDARCEQECMMEAATQPVTYYDDEELDQYRGRRSDDYSEEEAEQFREILLSMSESDVKGWNRSMILRGINVPDQVKDELLLFLDEK